MPTFREDTKIGGMVPMIKTDDINDQSVTKDKIRDGNVTAEKLADGAVSTDKLPDGAIKTPKIADGNITTSKLAEASVVTSKIADQNVTKEKIADQSVDNSKLSPEAVTYDKVKNKAITTEKLNDRAVTTEKVEEKAITNAKIGDSAVDGRVISEASVEKKHLANDSVATEKLQDSAITSDKIHIHAVTEEKIEDSAISNSKLADNSVGTSKIKDGNVTNEKVANNTITIDKFDPELRKSIQAATGLPENLVEVIQDVDVEVKSLHSKDEDLQSQIADKQQQITANDKDIESLKNRSTQMEQSINNIAVTGGASVANTVAYSNTASGLVSINAQGAIDELAAKNATKAEKAEVTAELEKKFDKESILQESGEAEDKVMSQKATTTAIADETTRAKAAEEAIVFDVSVYNNGAVFESLKALLSSSNLNILIPTSSRRGGMAIRFIQGSEQSSDNKYVQYRLMAASWSTTPSDWQGVDDVPIDGSDNLVKSSGVYNKFKTVGFYFNGNGDNYVGKTVSCLVPNHKYTIFLNYRTWKHEAADAISDRNVLAFHFGYNKKDGTFTDIVRIPVSDYNSIKSSYNFTVSSDTDGVLFFGGRADIGENINLTLIDITDTQKLFNNQFDIYENQKRLEKYENLSPNIICIETALDNKDIDANGNIIAFDRRVSDYIYCKGETYISGTYKDSRVGFYDKDRKFISVASEESGVVEVPSTAYYARIVFSHYTNNDYFIFGNNPNLTQDDYVPYGVNYLLDNVTLLNKDLSKSILGYQRLKFIKGKSEHSSNNHRLYYSFIKEDIIQIKVSSEYTNYEYAIYTYGIINSFITGKFVPNTLYEISIPYDCDSIGIYLPPTDRSFECTFEFTYDKKEKSIADLKRLNRVQLGLKRAENKSFNISPNILDQNNPSAENKRLKEDGTEEGYDVNISDYIYCKGQSHVSTNYDSGYICFYDKDLNFLSSDAQKNHSHVIPEKAFYFRSNFSKYHSKNYAAFVDNVNLTQDDYVPYGSEYLKYYTDNAVSAGTNSVFSEIEESRNNYHRNEYVYNFFDVSSKEEEHSSKKDRLYINIPANTLFKLNINCDAFNDNLISQAFIEYSDGTTDSVILPVSNTKYSYFVKNKDITSIGFYILNNFVSGRVFSSVTIINKDDINEIPQYWLNYLPVKIENIHANDEDTAFNGDMFIFFTDYHIEQNSGLSHKLIKYIVDRTNVNKVIFGGDAYNGGETREIALEKLRIFKERFAPLNVIGIRGNHEYNLNDGGSPEEILTDSEIFANISDKYKRTGVIRPSKDVMYGYLDNDKIKLRYIFLDSKYESSNHDLIDDVQLDWMASKMSELDSSWTILIFSHQFRIENGDYMPSGQKIADKISQTDYSATLAAIIYGHSHKDFYHDDLGYLDICTTCDSRQEDESWNQGSGTTDEHAFDVFAINLQKRTIKAVRIGRHGEDTGREWTY